MANATERIPVLVSASQKALLTRRAKAARLTVSEYLRRAGEAYRPEAETVDRLLEEVAKSVADAQRAMDEALRFVKASEARIAAMEAARRQKAA